MIIIKYYLQYVYHVRAHTKMSHKYDSTLWMNSHAQKNLFKKGFSALFTMSVCMALLHVLVYAHTYAFFMDCCE